MGFPAFAGLYGGLSDIYIFTAAQMASVASGTVGGLLAISMAALAGGCLFVSAGGSRRRL